MYSLKVIKVLSEKSPDNITAKIARPGYLLLPLLFNILPGVLANATKQQKGIKAFSDEKR